jgi:hypothetical protein
MNGQSSKRGQLSRPAKRPYEEGVIDFSASSSPFKRPNAPASSSRRPREPIVIDDDDDEEDEEAAYYEADYGVVPKAEARDTKPKVNGQKDLKPGGQAVGGMDQLDARDAVRTALIKLDSEVSLRIRCVPPFQEILSSVEERGFPP